MEAVHTYATTMMEGSTAVAMTSILSHGMEGIALVTLYHTTVHGLTLLLCIHVTCMYSTGNIHFIMYVYTRYNI